MVRPVYSKQFLHVDSSGGPTGGSVTVPAGVVWDIRNVHAVGFDPAPTGWPSSPGLTVITSTNIALVTLWTAAMNYDYRFETRAILPAGQNISWNLLGVGWFLDIAGFELTVP